MSGTITVGLDGTDHALAAVDWAATEASRRGMALRLVHAWVWRPLDVPIAVDADVQQGWARSVLHEGETRVTKAFPGLQVTTELLADDPVPALIAEAGEAEMLVLGSRGHGVLAGYLLGSVALHVLRETARPVVLVREPRSADTGQQPDEVVVGIQDTAETAAAVLSFGFAAAAAREVSLRAVWAWSVPTVFAWSPGSMWLADEAGGLEEMNKKRLAEALQPWRERYPRVHVIEHVEIGAAAEVLLSNSGRAGLVVVGCRSRGIGLRRIGAVAHAALHHAPAPVAVVPHP
ncbi:universal stress protein [Streptomyces netropsis]|uniref:universal stress protein n=1 Tax=Streptomyces netropsis TaxID=55404 RepID=UPI0037946EDF